ncbi:unnamed protein product [Musa acuminata subsp. burmannicoides]
MKASLPSTSLSAIHKKETCDSLNPPSQGCVAVEAGLCSCSTLSRFEAVKASMGDSKEGKNNGNSSGWMAVPAFGEWDMKNGVPDYSMDFTKIREMRKQNKHPSRASLGNDDELQLPSNNNNSNNNEGEAEEEPRRRRHRHGSPTGRKKKLMGCLLCCTGA